MSKISQIGGLLLRLLPQFALLALLISAPVLAMANTGGGSGMFIEHQQKKNSGFGFVLLVSLQR